MSDIQIKIEKIKTLMIVVLLITAMLLLSFFWRGLSLDDLRSISVVNNENRYKPQVSELVVPEYLKVGVGSDGYTIFDPEHHMLNVDGNIQDVTLYNKFINIIKDYLEQDDISAEKIEKSQYHEVMAYASMSAEFAFKVPFREYIRKNGISLSGNVSPIEDMTTITLSPFSSENLFVIDRSSGNYYRIAINNDNFSKTMATSLNELITSLNKSASSSYYAIKDVTGADNDRMIPIYMKSYMQQIPYNLEFSISERSDIIATENTFFSDGMDFVRRITENKGSLIYVFGLNEKVLTLHENGQISYTEEFDSSSYEEQNLYETVETAIEYISLHGGWKSISEVGGDVYLKDVSRIFECDGKYGGYRLVFGTKVRGVPLEYDKGNVISLKICGSQVISYEREIIQPDVSNLNSEEWEAAAPLDILTVNYRTLYDTIISEENNQTDEADNNIIENEEKKFDYVMSNIDNIEFCMYRNTESGEKLISPKWIIEVKNIIFRFEPKEGNLEGYTVIEDD